MSERAWDDLLELLDTKYQIDKHEKSEEAIEGNPGLKRQIHAVFFEKDNQKFKIERIVSPAIIDTKTHYAHRGAAHRIEHKYDAEETSSKVTFYKAQPDGYWNEITPESMLT